MFEMSNIPTGNIRQTFHSPKRPYLASNPEAWTLNADIGGVSSNIYGIVADIGTPSGEGLDFKLMNGMAFLERYYSVYDTANKRVGLAQTYFTFVSINWEDTL